MFFFAPIETWAPGYLEGEDAGFAVGGLWVAGNVFAPAAAAGSSIKTVNGLALASVKTVDGLAAASVKTMNGLA